MDLRESTAVTINLGPFVDKTDGVTPETGVTMTVKLSKNGGTMAARNSGTAITHDADGYYKVALNTIDTNTRGDLRIMATDAATHVPVWRDCNVLSAAAYDAKYGADLVLQAAASGTATLDTGASAVDDYYNGALLVITSGPGVGQTRRIIDYVGSTKVATIDTAWITNPTSSSTFQIIGAASVALSSVERAAVATELLDQSAGVQTSWTVREALRVMLASLAGKINGATSGAGTTNVRDVGDTKNRMVVTQDANGNRSAITYDKT